MTSPSGPSILSFSINPKVQILQHTSAISSPFCVFNSVNYLTLLRYRAAFPISISTITFLSRNSLDSSSKPLASSNSSTILYSYRISFYSLVSINLSMYSSAGLQSSTTLCFSFNYSNAFITWPKLCITGLALSGLIRALRLAISTKHFRRLLCSPSLPYTTSCAMYAYIYCV
jgi:hypothetical protein